METNVYGQRIKLHFSKLSIRSPHCAEIGRLSAKSPVSKPPLITTRSESQLLKRNSGIDEPVKFKQFTAEIYHDVFSEIIVRVVIIFCIVFYISSFYNLQFYSPLTFIIAPLLILFYNLRFTVTSEDLIIVPSSGVQIVQKTFLGGILSVKFILESEIKAIVINETIKRQRVIPYLALILWNKTSDGAEIVPIFKKTLPRLTSLQYIYQEITT